MGGNYRGWGQPKVLGRRALTRLANACFIAVLLAAILPARTLSAQEVSAVYDVSECADVDEAYLQENLERIALDVLESENRSGGIDVGKIVIDNWKNMDAVVDRAVDDAVERVKSNSLRSNIFLSGFRVDWAEYFAGRVADSAFSSDLFKNEINELSERVVNDLEEEIQLITIASASSALLCVEEFISRKFSATMVVALEDHVQKGLHGVNIEEVKKKLDTDSLRRVNITLDSIVFFAAAQISRALGKNFAQGLAGKIFGRIVG
ncbi:MAG: hypothetical protein F4Y42_03810 [Caldilineaceae bacterium SB0664_bin_27]|uniref:Uncharacterized protein n=1 Tax=Caldilineaceae bacterium SB0664_bin_27 TaxID=2605260 RepID=A0A6B0YQX6_9CHLR|nr:hypothetical protein [Caldilineaceae bacterium SB0664_bin_27]